MQKRARVALRRFRRVQLRAAIDALGGMLSVRVEGQRRKTTSREAIPKLVKRGVAAVEVLDAIVKPRLV